MQTPFRFRAAYFPASFEQIVGIKSKQTAAIASAQDPPSSSISQPSNASSAITSCLVASKLKIISLSVALLLGSSLSAQFLDLLDNEGGYLFGIKVGPSVAAQNWSSLQTSPLLTYHGDLFLESLPAQGQFSLWTSLGYHVRGSRITRRNGVDFSGNIFRIPGESFQFRNLSLAAGGKQVFKYTALGDVFYTLGVRLEYNINTNLGNFDELNSFGNVRLFYPFNSYDFIRRVTYGVSAGGGIDIPLSDKVGAFIMVTVAPDLSMQYNQPPIANVADPFRPGQTLQLSERRIRNFSLEISAGFRFLRKIIYVD